MGAIHESNPNPTGSALELKNEYVNLLNDRPADLTGKLNLISEGEIV